MTFQRFHAYFFENWLTAIDFDLEQLKSHGKTACLKSHIYTNKKLVILFSTRKSKMKKYRYNGIYQISFSPCGICERIGTLVYPV